MKHQKPSRLLQLSASLAACLALVACAPSETETTEPSASSAAAAAQLFLESAPSAPLSVMEARAQLAPGDTAIVAGQIGGTAQPFVAGYAAFVLADTEVMFCNEMDHNQCPTPWDACCVDPDKLSALRASVQFDDAQGQVLALDLKGQQGLKELSHVTVTGRVAETSTPENLIILADGLYIEPLPK